MPFPRRCSKCASAGPFYASQPSPAAWCKTCQKSASARAYARHGPAINQARRDTRLAALLAIDPDTRTRRQSLRLLRMACPPGKKVCGYCWQVCELTAFRVCRGSIDQRDYYCRDCRQILDRLRSLAQKRRD